MPTLEVFPRDIDSKAFRYGVVGDDCSVLVKESTRIMHQGKLVASYIKLPSEMLEPVRQAVTSLKFSGGSRTLGIKQNSITFGYMPRNAIRNNVCRPTKMATQFKEQHEVVCGIAPSLDNYYRDQAPMTYKMHAGIVGLKVLPNWRIRSSVFTSGIINKNCAMNYHTDTGNFPGCWSAMIVFKHKMNGGHLCLPQFNVAIECADCSLLLFNGQEYMHGVSPLSGQDESAYRYSLVYYSLQQLWHCLAPKAEFQRLLKDRTDRERNKFKRMNQVLKKGEK